MPDLASLRAAALRIFQAGLRAADPYLAIQRIPDLRQSVGSRPLIVIGAGKATARMAEAIENIFGDQISAGWINVKYGHTAPLTRIHQHECGHPLPDAAGVEGTERMLQLLAERTPEHVIIALISGGASALTPLPVPGVSLEEKQLTTQVLLRCGATIHELNAIRKHLSRFKGGQLARALYPSPCLALLLSDVIHDDLDVIGSGPTAPDTSTFADALAVLDRYQVRDQVPASVLRHLEAAEIETPKPGDAIFQRVDNRIIASNALALDASAAEARRLGYQTLILGSDLQGETRDSALLHLTHFQRYLPPICILSGGETTVTLRGSGKGGRNQEFVLALVDSLSNYAPAVALSAGTDGTDGPTDAAGAIADSSTAERARSLGLEPSVFLANNDSYHFFEPLSDLIITGPTGTNVMDLRILLR